MSVRRMGGMRAAEQGIYQVRLEQGKAAVASISSSTSKATSRAPKVPQASQVSGYSNISGNSSNLGSSSVSRYSEEDRERVIEAFKKAMQPENEKERRKTMEERIQAIITQGGAGTLTVDDQDDHGSGQGSINSDNNTTNINANTNLNGATLLGKEEGAQTVMSPPAWGEDDEADFQRRLEEAKEASLRDGAAAKNGERGEKDGGEEADTKAFEEELRKAMELSLAEQKAFEKQVLEAAAQWREGEGEDGERGARGKDVPS